MPCNHPRVAYLGPRGTYTHQAASKIFNDRDYCVDPAELIPDVFCCVASGEARYGVIPISNSTKGVVGATLASFKEVGNLFPDVWICGEIHVRVSHCLMGRKPSATSAAILSTAPMSGSCTPTVSQPNPETPRSKPLYGLKHITKVYSHEQALAQCSIFLDAYLRHAERIEVSSTSRAAELAYEDKTGASAGISSIMAANLYGIDVLASDIQNAEINATRFYILRKMSPGEDIALIPKDIRVPQGSNTKWKGFMHMTLPENRPENLGKIISSFVSQGISVVEVHSQPREGRPFGLDYFLTIETQPPKRSGDSLERLIKDIALMAESLRWFGYWPKVDWKSDC